MNPHKFRKTVSDSNAYVFERAKTTTHDDTLDTYRPITRQGISVEERDAKIETITNYINTLMMQNTSNQIGYNEITGTLDSQPDKSAHFFYFIGRLNPPHNGHIKALTTLVRMAKDTGSVALILLGSGPKQERTLDNPITFELKKAFINQQLEEQHFSPGDYVITQMTNPATNVSAFIAQQLEKLGDTLDNIQITHIAGGKDEDTTKLDFVKKFAEKTAQGIAPGAIISTGVEVIDATPTDSGVAMSATKVRKDAYRSLLDGRGFAGWSDKYSRFYGRLSEAIYDEILFPVRNIPEPQQLDAISNYIDNDILPTIGAPTKAKAKASTPLKAQPTKKRNIKGGKNINGSKNYKGRTNRQTRRHKKKTHRKRRC